MITNLEDRYRRAKYI